MPIMEIMNPAEIERANELHRTVYRLLASAAEDLRQWAKAHVCHASSESLRLAAECEQTVVALRNLGSSESTYQAQQVDACAPPVAFGAHRYGQWGYIWHEEDDVAGWIQLRNASLPDPLTHWHGPVALFTP